jgi:hypothetical protein
MLLNDLEVLLLRSIVQVFIKGFLGFAYLGIDFKLTSALI